VKEVWLTILPAVVGGCFLWAAIMVAPVVLYYMEAWWEFWL
jgi:hypothetical protein